MCHLVEVLPAFTSHAGLQVKCDKFGILLKGQWSPMDTALLFTLGYPIVSSYQYLGNFVCTRHAS